MAKLTITSGPDKGREFPLGDTQVIGRIGRCAIPIKDSRASREHARIYRGEGGFFVVDLNSKNGVIVNGQKVEKMRLLPGDEIQIGDTWCRIDFLPEEAGPSLRSGPERRTPAPAPTSSGSGVLLRVRDGSGRGSDEPLRSAMHRAPRAALSGGMTRTSLAWLRTDLTQVSWLYRALLGIGVLLLAAGLAYLAWRLAA